MKCKMGKQDTRRSGWVREILECLHSRGFSCGEAKLWSAVVVMLVDIMSERLIFDVR